MVSRTVDSRRKTLIIANDRYEHELGELRAPSTDAGELSRILGDQRIGGFSVKVIHNNPAHMINREIEDLFTEGRPGDLLLLHMSCHGLKSESGRLFFAAPDTRPGRLGSTAVSADFIQSCFRWLIEPISS